jgi:transcriptional regulator with XRE-family HTH domain
MIGNCLKRMRNIYGYKASEMSKALGISQSYLSEIENEKKSPNLELLQKYADFFQIKLSSLILIAETYENSNSQEKGENLIGRMMIQLVEKLSKKEASVDEE